MESIRGKWAVFLETGSSSTDGYYHLASHELATDVGHEYFLKGFSGPGSTIPILGGQVASLFAAFFLTLKNFPIRTAAGRPAAPNVC